MGKLQVFIDPGLRLSRQRRRQLAGGEHHLVITVGEVIAVNVHVIKVVVKAYCLRLLISLKQRTFIPQANILNGIFISGDHSGRQVSQRGIRRLLNRFQVVCLASETDEIV